MTAAHVVAGLPSGPAFTVVLVCHVAAVLVGILAVVASAVAALRVLGTRGGSLAPSLHTYYAPGVNWAGRALYLVPGFGAALVVMSGGAYPIGAAWVLSGIGMWVAATVLAEVALWPAERRVQRALSAGTPRPGEVPADVLRSCRAIVVSAAGVLVIVVSAMVVMFAKP